MLIAAVVGVLMGAVAAWLVARVLFEGRSAALSTERDLMRERVIDLEASISDGAQTATMLAPLHDALVRVERQVGTLERDRVEQFSQVSMQLADVTTSTNALRSQTASLAGSLNASTIRGNWGEVQLRRVLEHAGMLASRAGSASRRGGPPARGQVPGRGCQGSFDGVPRCPG